MYIFFYMVVMYSRYVKTDIHYPTLRFRSNSGSKNMSDIQPTVFHKGTNISIPSESYATIAARPATKHFDTQVKSNLVYPKGYIPIVISRDGNPTLKQAHLKRLYERTGEEWTNYKCFSLANRSNPHLLDLVHSIGKTDCGLAIVFIPKGACNLQIVSAIIPGQGETLLFYHEGQLYYME